MKRRTFIFGGVLLSTLSLAATATNASLSETVSSTADFSVIAEEGRTAELIANPNTPDTLSTHTWTTNDVTSDSDIDTIEANYDFGDNEATFENVDSEDSDTDPGDIIVELTRELSNGLDRTTINVNDDTFSGSTAVFDLSGIQTTNIVNDPDNPNLRVAIDAAEQGAGIENPAAADTYVPTLTLTAENGESFDVKGELTIVSGEPFFTTAITAVPQTFTPGEPVQVDYEVDNTGDEAATQDIVLLVKSTQADSTSVTLDPDAPPATGSLSYTPTSGDGTSIDLTIASDDDSSMETITRGSTFSLSVDPATAGASDATHTWTANNVDFQGEVDTITVDYNSSGATLDGIRTDRDGGDLDQDVVVRLTRELSGGPSKDIIGLNNGDSPYSGSTATFDLSGSFTTNIVGEVEVIVGYNSVGVANPDTPDTYTADITLDGADDTFTDTAQFTIE